MTLEQDPATTEAGNIQIVAPGEEPAKPESDAGQPDAETMKAANAEVKAWAERVGSENKQLREGAMRTALTDIGLNFEQGLGVAIADSYEGVITAEAVSAYALEKYKHQAAQAIVPPVVVAGEKLDDLNALSSPVTPPVKVDEAQEATDKMFDPEAGVDEARTSLAHKMAQFNQEHYLPKNQE